MGRKIAKTESPRVALEEVTTSETSREIPRSTVLVFYSDRRGKKFREFSNFFSEMPSFMFVLPKFSWRDGFPKSSQCEFSEKAIMLVKAAMMGDIEAFWDLQKASDAKSCKAIGRGIRNFDEELWKAHLESIAFEVIRQKFEANSELRELLLSTGEKVIAEASPNDPIWGIGVGVADDRSLDPARWCGYNILGYALMRVRSYPRGAIVLDMETLAGNAGHDNFSWPVYLTSTFQPLQGLHLKSLIGNENSALKSQLNSPMVESLLGITMQDKEDDRESAMLPWQGQLRAMRHLKILCKGLNSQELDLMSREPCSLVHNVANYTDSDKNRIAHDSVRTQEDLVTDAIMTGPLLKPSQPKDPDVHYVTGDATKVGYGKGGKIISHIVNDKGRWGRGFVMALSKEFGDGPRREYFEWHRDRAETDFRLGAVQFVQVKTQILVANMVGQCGIKTGSQGPPVRYEAISECLQILGERACEKGASVHMPRIACGLAGGQWERIRPMVEHMSSIYGISVYVYDI